MLLKKHYARDEKGLCSHVNGIEIKRIPKSGIQRFSPKLIAQGTQQGWLAKDDKHIIIDCCVKGKVRFKIISVVERKCLHCKKPFPSIYEDPTGMVVRNHIVEKHSGKTSPSKEHPSGYTIQNYFEAKLEGNSWLTKFLT